MNKALLIAVFCFLIGLNSNSQNLVPNPSFEDKYDCTYAILSNAKEWCSVSRNCSYLFPCQTNQYYQAPHQYLNSCLQSYQIPRTGSAYAEIFGYITTSTLTPNKYAQVKLMDTLKPNKIYCLSFYLSLFNFSQYSTDKIGAVLTPTPFPCLPPATAPNYTVTGVTPSIYSTPGVQLDDTLNWMEVSGTYTANGTEAYITIGDFFLQNQHSIVQSYPANCNAVAEYYLDDVSVEEVHPAKAKNDTTIMFGDSTIIGNNPSEAALYNWQPATGLSCISCPNPKASPNSLTTYTVTKTQCKSVTTDVITVNVDATGLVSSGAAGNGLKLYPNPVTEILNVECKMINDKSDLQIRLSDVVGREILLTEYKSQFDISDLEKGIYFISILRNGKPLVTQKIVKE